MNDSIRIQPADPRCEEAGALTRALSEEEAICYADLGTDYTFDSFRPEDALTSRGAFVMAWKEAQPVGCGALRESDRDAAEINRMYVAPSVRRRGVGRMILAELERRAMELGYRVVRLETGNRQLGAISLYESSGFRRVPPFGSHANDPVSVFFEKILPGCRD